MAKKSWIGPNESAKLAVIISVLVLFGSMSFIYLDREQAAEENFQYQLWLERQEQIKARISHRFTPAKVCPACHKDLQQ